MEKPVTFSSLYDEGSIYGVMHEPDHYQHTVIIFNGLNGDRVDIHRSGVQFARMAESNDIRCIRFDYRGHGITDYNFIQTTIETKLQDAESVLKHAAQSGPVDVIGFSDGAKMAYALAQRFPNLIRQVVLWSPVFITGNANHSDKIRMMKEKLGGRIALPYLGLWFGPKMVASIQRNVVQDIAPVQRVIVFTGERDEYVKPTMSYLQQQIPQFEHVAIREANHVYSDAKWKNELFSNTITVIKGGRAK